MKMIALMKLNTHSVESFQDIRWSQVQLVQDDPMALPHGIH